MERQRATHNCLCLTFHNSSFFPGRENTSFLAILEFIIIPLRNIFFYYFADIIFKHHHYTLCDEIVSFVHCPPSLYCIMLLNPGYFCNFYLVPMPWFSSRPELMAGYGWRSLPFLHRILLSPHDNIWQLHPALTSASPGIVYVVLCYTQTFLYNCILSAVWIPPTSSQSILFITPDGFTSTSVSNMPPWFRIKILNRQQH